MTTQESFKDVKITIEHFGIEHRVHKLEYSYDEIINQIVGSDDTTDIARFLSGQVYAVALMIFLENIKQIKM